MQYKKPALLIGTLTTLGAVTVMGLNTVSATTDTSGQSGIVDKLAQKFNLDKNEVQKVFEEDRAAHKAEHQARMEEKLTQAVKDGKLTEDQKTKLLAKLQEIKDDRPDPSKFKDKTEAERKAHVEQMEQKHEELKKWAADNNIPEEYLPFVMHKVHGRGHGGPGKHLKMHFDDRDSQ